LSLPFMESITTTYSRKLASVVAVHGRWSYNKPLTGAQEGTI
jgi:hypothetical protein